MGYASEAGLVQLIGDIYDAVIDKTLWGKALEGLRQRFNFQLAILSAHRRRMGNPILQVSVNIPDEYLMQFPQFAAEALEVWGGAARIEAFALEEPVLTPRFTDRAFWETFRYYREWVRPQGIVDQVGMILVRDRSMISALGLAIHHSRPPITDEEMDALRVVAPHLSRAVVISGMLDAAFAVTATFQAALEATTAGVVLVDGNMKIIHANRAALAMLETGDPVRGSKGRLTLRDEFIPGQLLAAVNAASRDEASLGRRGFGIPSRQRDGTPVSINVMPLERRSQRLGVDIEAKAAIFIGDAAPIQLPAEAMRLLYDLTPAEQRVFELVVEGEGTEDIASALGIATSTVRTHLLSVFNKTDRHSRADLVLLARDIRLPT